MEQAVVARRNSAQTYRFKRLSEELDGSVILPGDADYDSLRKPWLDVIEQRPAVIVEAASSRDVVSAVSFARNESLALGVMSTGHGIAAPCDDGLLLRFSKMIDVAVDVSRRTAMVGPGVLSMDLLRAAEKDGLVYPAGQVGNVGVIGFALGGGIGWLVRKLGVAADWIVGAEVVLADGSMVHADASTNVDLFWALRGGGGNFGVVVSLEIALSPLSDLTGGEIYFPIERVAELLHFYRDWSSTLSNDTSSVFRIMSVPPTETAPSEIRGQVVCMIGVCHANPETADPVFEPLSGLGTPLLSDVKRRTLASMAGLDPASHMLGSATYGQVEHLRALSDAVIAGLARLARTVIPPLMQFELQQLGGTLLDVAHDRRGAFEPSSAAYLLHIESPAIKASMGELATATAGAFAALGDAYIGEKCYNFLRGDEQANVPHAFGLNKFERLRTIKQRFDPANLFHLNLNVPPAHF